MKFVCHSCSTKYSISDDKVAGGTFRVRCKRCGETLVLRDGTVEVTTSSHDLQPEEPQLRSQRNENSLLFSLRDGGHSAEMLAPVTSASKATAQAETVRQEGSGLLDIQRLAASYQTSAGTVSSGSAVPTRITDDYTPPAFVLPRPATEAEPHKRLLWGLFTAAGSLAVASLVLAMVVLGRGNRPGQEPTIVEPAAQTVAATTLTPSTPETAVTPTPPSPLPEPAEKTDTTGENTDATSVTVAANPVRQEGASETKPESTKPIRARPRTEPTRTERTTERSEPAERETSNSTDAGKAGSCLDEIGCELADHPPACCTRYDSSSPDRSSRPDSSDSTRNVSLPDVLDRAAVMKGISAVRSKVQACSASHSAQGTVMVRLKVGGDGRVDTATIKETPDKALGQCVAQAMRSARFDRSKQGLSFNYPFVF